MADDDRRRPVADGTAGPERWGVAGKAPTGMIVISLGVVVVVAVGYVLWPKLQGAATQSFSSTTRSNAVSPVVSPPPPKPEVPLTQESIELLLNDVEQAVKQKNVDGVLRHIAPDAVILIHMKQGSHQQTAMLTRDEYGKALASEFAFPSANDFARSNTTVSLASDERSAKVSFKTTETLRQANREFRVEGEETLVVRMRGSKPAIVSLEKGVPGDST